MDKKTESKENAKVSRQQMSDEDKQKLKEGLKGKGLISGLIYAKKNGYLDKKPERSESGYIKTTYDKDKNEYTHTIDIGKFLDSQGNIDNNKMKDFVENDLKKNPEAMNALKSMYEQDKKNGYLNDLTDSEKAVLDSKLGGSANKAYDEDEMDKILRNLGPSGDYEETINQMKELDGYFKKLNEYQDKAYEDGSFEKLYNNIANNIRNENKNVKDFYEDDGAIFRESGDFFKYKGKSVDYIDFGDEIHDILNKRFDKKYASDPDVMKAQKIFNKNLTDVHTRQAKALQNHGYTIEQIAKKLGVPVGTVSSYLYG